MKVYRIQHRDSGLGPFEHPSPNHKQPGLTYIRIGSDHMENIDEIPEVKKLLRKYRNKLRFGWVDKSKALLVIRDEKKLNELGFGLIEIDTEPLFINESDKQCVFLST
jgi:hypothetical protein